MSITFIKTPAEAKAFLRGKGTKVALQVACDSEYIFAEKSDFIEFYLTGPSFIDYDGNELLEHVYVPLHGHVLHVPAGTKVGVAQ
ncbi:hypothetical protein CRP114_gp4 [Roseobacter phage CRP-114]|uniref:Uncharacterized protein n=1 Tax=Roseobacter phage CRP-114 TaxID=3072842 RepID=A0AAX3ZWK2_9CAUD|nr:hypothetical protein CRP114_gp4 [Roseobacter phage CRP-114]